MNDYDNYLSRLRAWPRYVDQQIEQMRLGIKRGWTLPRAVLTGIDGTISAHVVESPEKSVFWKPFEHFPAAIPEAERERLRKEGRQAVMDSAVAGYRSSSTSTVRSTCRARARRSPPRTCPTAALSTPTRSGATRPWISPPTRSTRSASPRSTASRRKWMRS